MKRFTTNWTLVLMAVLSFSLMSCQDDDERLAYYLDGVWSGIITDDVQNYDTTIEFVQDGYYSTSGYGYEYDKGWSYGRTKETYFEWYISNGNIYLQYEDAPHDYIVMDYHSLPVSTELYERLFGVFRDSYGYVIADFDLKKVSNHHNYYAKENTHTEAEK